MTSLRLTQVRKDMNHEQDKNCDTTIRHNTIGIFLMKN